MGCRCSQLRPTTYSSASGYDENTRSERNLKQAAFRLDPPNEDQAGLIMLTRSVVSALLGDEKKKSKKIWHDGVKLTPKWAR